MSIFCCFRILDVRQNEVIDENKNNNICLVSSFSFIFVFWYDLMIHHFCIVSKEKCEKRSQIEQLFPFVFLFFLFFVENPRTTKVCGKEMYEEKKRNKKQFTNTTDTIYFEFNFNYDFCRRSFSAFPIWERYK